MPCTKVGKYTICLEYVLIGAVLLIFVYGYLVRNFLGKDILETNILGFSGGDGWGVLHFLLFFILAFLYPDRFILLTAFGCVWEGIETILGQYKIMMFGRRIQIIGATDDQGKSLEGKEAEDSWWYGRISDVALDTVGIVAGIYARFLYDKKTPFCECSKCPEN